MTISVIWFGLHSFRPGLHTFDTRLHIVGAGLRIIKTKRGWGSQCADQAPEIENPAPELGSQASTNDVYLRKSGWPDLGWASIKMFYLCNPVWASLFPNWASHFRV